MEQLAVMRLFIIAEDLQDAVEWLYHQQRIAIST
jgi:hypothetical protein